MREQRFNRPAGECLVWLGGVPEWAAVQPVGTVDGYWRWRAEPPASAPGRAAGWGFRRGLGGRGEYGVLGATFEPHDYPFLQASVAATTAAGSRGKGPFRAATVELPHEYVGGVLAGVLQESERLGPGRVRFSWAATHPVDSSWEAFRCLAIGVARLLALPEGEPVPDGYLPHFGGTTPDPPGSP